MQQRIGCTSPELRAVYYVRCVRSQGPSQNYVQKASKHERTVGKAIELIVLCCSISTQKFNTHAQVAFPSHSSSAFVVRPWLIVFVHNRYKMMDTRGDPCADSPSISDI